MLRLLVVEDDPDVAALIPLAIDDSDLTVVVSGFDALVQNRAWWRGRTFDAAIVDYRLGGTDVTGLDIVEAGRKLLPGCRWIIYTASDSLGDLPDDVTVVHKRGMSVPELRRALTDAP